MSERITERDLDEYEQGSSALSRRDMAMELRRLRGLIVAFDGNSGYCCACIGCDDSATAAGESSHDPECPWARLLGEAEAIRKDRT